MPKNPNIALPPLSLLILATVTGSVVFVLALQFMLQGPWLGVELTSDSEPGLIVTHTHSAESGLLAPGTRVIAVTKPDGARLALNSTHLRSNLEFLNSYAAFNRYWSELQELNNAVNNHQIRFITDRNETVSVPVRSERPLNSLPASIWLLVLNAAITFLVGITVWTFQQRSLPAALLCLCGISLSVHHMVYATSLGKPLLADPANGILLVHLAHASGALFLYAGTALIWHYPTPVNRFPMGSCLFLAWALVCLTISNQWFEFPLNSYDSHLLLLLVIAGFIAWRQWQRHAHQPEQRAALKWFLLSIFVNTSIVSLIWGIPFIITGKTLLPKYFISLFWLLIYLGFVAGVLRYRLFDLDRWWFNAWAWLAAAIPVVIADIVLIYLIQADWQPLLIVSLILVGWLYFPAKHWLLGRLFNRQDNSLEQYLPNFIEALYTDASPDHQWQQLLNKVYAPLHQESVSTPGNNEFLLQQDGLTLEVPRLNSEGRYRLTGRNQSARLFSSDDIKLAQSLFELIQQATDIRAARETGAQQEREKNMSLFATVSHEFRTPLTLILGPLSRLQQDINPADINMMKRNAERMLYLVDELIELACINVGETRNKQVIDLQAVCHECCLAVAPLAEIKQLQLTRELTGPWWIECYQDALHKILFNLLSNAVKYSNAPGHIQVSLNKTEQQNRQWLQLQVSDEGPGIPEIEQATIFNQFTRATQQNSPRGFGLGLATVKELVLREGGTITLQSRPGQGSCFTVTLPYDPHILPGTDSAPTNPMPLQQTLLEEIKSTETPPTETTPATPPADSDQPQILVIEDHGDMRQFIVSSLTPGYHTLQASNGEAGVALATEQIPDLILCDVMMPGIDGFEVCRQLKQDERTSHIPIVLLTARDDKASRLAGWEHQADEYLSKPFDVNELRLRIENLLSIRRLLQQRFNSKLSELHLQQSRELLPDQAQELTQEHTQEHTQEQSPQQPAALNPLDQAFMDRLDAVIASHYSNPDFKLDDMASAMAKSERQLHRKFKALTDKTPMEYLRWYRLEAAAKLLRQGERAGDVAARVGFSSASYFSNCFKTYFGLAPKDYREQHH